MTAERKPKRAAQRAPEYFPRSEKMILLSMILSKYSESIRQS
jgi:hypothetical protein